MRQTILMTILVVGSACWVDAQIPQIEREALVALYDITDGPNWTNNTGWAGSAGTECTWVGVTCDGGRVRELFLDSNNLHGNLPPELGNLSALEWLDLSLNRLSGELPPELGNLASMRVLSLSFNRLTGSLPPETGNLTNLISLEISFNRLSGPVPAEIGNLANLGYAALIFNQLSGPIPPELGNLAAIHQLYLQSNRLSGKIPSELTSLTTLHDGFGIDLRFNALHSDDSDLIAFLNTKHDGGDWQSSQTVAPENLSVVWTGDHTVWLSWDPVSYEDPGGYEVILVPTAGGPPGSSVRTASKTEIEIPAPALDPGVSYDFEVISYTLPHPRNHTLVTSDPSEAVMATTSNLGCAQPVITMTWGDPATLSVPGSFDSYLWNTGETTSSIDVSPYETRFYWATVASSGPCQESAMIFVDAGYFFGDGFESGDTSAWQTTTQLSHRRSPTSIRLGSR